MILIIVLCLGIIAMGIYAKKKMDEVCSIVIPVAIAGILLFFMISGLATGIFAKQEVVVKEYSLSPIYGSTYVEIFDKQDYRDKYVRCNYLSNEPLGYIETTMDLYREDIVRIGEENKLFVVQYEFKYKLIKAIFTEIGFVKRNVIQVIEVE